MNEFNDNDPEIVEIPLEHLQYDRSTIDCGFGRTGGATNRPPEVA